MKLKSFFPIIISGMVLLSTQSCSIARTEQIMQENSIKYKIAYFDDYAEIRVTEFGGTLYGNNHQERSNKSVTVPEFKVEYNKKFDTELGLFIDGESQTNYKMSGIITKNNGKIIFEDITIIASPFNKL